MTRTVTWDFRSEKDSLLISVDGAFCLWCPGLLEVNRGFLDLRAGFTEVDFNLTWLLCFMENVMYSIPPPFHCKSDGGGGQL